MKIKLTPQHLLKKPKRLNKQELLRVLNAIRQNIGIKIKGIRYGKYN